jgi:predicted nucleic acid-binding protein
MVYLDTNVLVYASVNQDAIKHKQSLDLIERLVTNIPKSKVILKYTDILVV